MPAHKFDSISILQNATNCCHRCSRRRRQTHSSSAPAITRIRTIFQCCMLNVCLTEWMQLFSVGHHCILHHSQQWGCNQNESGRVSGIEWERNAIEKKNHRIACRVCARALEPTSRGSQPSNITYVGVMHRCMMHVSATVRTMSNHSMVPSIQCRFRWTDAVPV